MKNTRSLFVELDATAYLALQHNQLLPEHSILCFKSAFRLERRGPSSKQKEAE